MSICAWKREIINENTNRGRRDALRRGVKFGRKPPVSKQRKARIIKAREDCKTLKEIAEAESLSVGYIHRICNPDKAWVYNENHLNHQAEKRKAAAP